MRLALFASALTATIMWFALGNNTPARSQQSETKPATCQTCGQAKNCPSCGQAHHGWGGPHKWEYKCVHQSERPSKKAAEAMTEQFTGLGEEGWHLAKADGGFWCFTRMPPAQ